MAIPLTIEAHQRLLASLQAQQQHWAAPSSADNLFNNLAGGQSGQCITDAMHFAQGFGQILGDAHKPITSRQFYDVDTERKTEPDIDAMPIRKYLQLKTNDWLKDVKL